MSILHTTESTVERGSAPSSARNVCRGEEERGGRMGGDLYRQKCACYRSPRRIREHTSPRPPFLALALRFISSPGLFWLLSHPITLRAIVPGFSPPSSSSTLHTTCRADPIGSTETTFCSESV
eukprot:990347-Rhodomonas_salina.2